MKIDSYFKTSLTLSILSIFIFISCNQIDVSVPSLKNSITGVSKKWLSRKGGEEIFIEGNFSKNFGLAVTIDNKSCKNLEIHSNKLLSCTTPANSSIKNVELKVLTAGQVSARFGLKYVGVLGQSSPNYVIQKARGFNAPVMVKNLNSKLYIGDLGNKRIVGFNHSSLLGDRDFDFVLGLPNMFSAHDVVSLEFGKFHPRDLDFSNDLFMFADAENHRVLIFDGIPTGLQKPKIILGQPDALSNQINNGTISEKSLNRPMSAKFIDGKIFVSEEGNNRILVWNSIPTSNFAPADFVLGQADFNTGTANRGGLIGANTLNRPIAMEKIGNKLFVSDAGNGRVLIWNSIPSSNVPADSVIGQVDLTSKNLTASAIITKGPGHFKYYQSTFYLSDYDGNRVLVYKNFDISSPIANGKTADIVLGQPNFTSITPWTSGGTIDAKTLTRPYSIEIVDNKLLVGATGDHRIVVYNHLPFDVVLDQHLAADSVIGQESLTVGLADRSTPGARYLPKPSNVAVHDGKLFINSETYGRISVWNSIPTEDFAPADFVLGQNGFGHLDMWSNRSTSIINPTANTLYTPYQMLSYDGKFFVSDLSNNRILIWNSITGVNGQAADSVLGQADLMTRISTPVSATSLKLPAGMEIVDSHLVVNDRGNNRILVFDTVPTSGPATPEHVIGQSDFVSFGINGSSIPSTTLSASTFNSPFNSARWLGRYVVSDHANRRILFWNSFEDFLDKEPATAVWGQDDFLSLNILQTGINRGGDLGTVRVVDNILYFVDPYNHRILVFSNPSEGFYFKPTSVLGQYDFDTRTRLARDTFSAETFQRAIGMYEFENYSFIADYMNHRVLIIPK